MTEITLQYILVIYMNYDIMLDFSVHAALQLKLVVLEPGAYGYNTSQDIISLPV